MKLTKIKTTVMAGVLAASMVLPGMTAMAASVPQIKKTVLTNSNVTSIPAADQTITFKIKQVDNADGNAYPSEITLDDVVDGYGTKTVTAAKATGDTPLAKDILSTDELDQLKTGEYTFEITEDTSIKTTTDYGWTKVASDTYYLQVLVPQEGDNIYKISTVKGSTDASHKKLSADFSNTYNKNSNDEDEKDPKNYTLKVSKKVENATYVDETQTYTIKVVVTVPKDVTGTITENDKTVYNITNNAYTWDGDAAGRVVDKEAGTITFTKSIADGADFTISNIAVGATFTVEETNTADLKNWSKVEYSYNSGAAETTCSKTFGEADATVEVQNTFTDITPTGVVTSIAPYVTLVVLAVAAVAAYMAMKSRVAR